MFLQNVRLALPTRSPVRTRHMYIRLHTPISSESSARGSSFNTPSQIPKMGLIQTFGNICNICWRVQGALCIRRKPIYFARLQRTPAESGERNGSLKKSQVCIPPGFWALAEPAFGWFEEIKMDACYNFPFWQKVRIR